MTITELQAWLELQKSIYGDIDVVCMTAPCHVPEGEKVTLDELMVATPNMLGLLRDNIDGEKNVVAIGYGCKI